MFRKNSRHKTSGLYFILQRVSEGTSYGSQCWIQKGKTADHWWRRRRNKENRIDRLVLKDSAQVFRKVHKDIKGRIYADTCFFSYLKPSSNYFPTLVLIKGREESLLWPTIFYQKIPRASKETNERSWSSTLLELHVGGGRLQDLKFPFYSDGHQGLQKVNDNT